MTEDGMYDIIRGYEDSERDYHERNIELEAENAKLRELATDACTVLRSHYDKDWFDGTVFAERMCELGIEVPE